jgi:hypothetical protein
MVLISGAGKTTVVFLSTLISSPATATSYRR